jgi:Glycosyltransferase family 87
MSANLKAAKTWWIYPGVLLVALSGFYFLLNDGVDYHFTFYPSTRLWLEGRTPLYDELTKGLYNPPWLIWLITPFTLLPYQFGLSLLRAISLTIIVYAIMRMTEHVKGYPRLLALAFGIFNLHMLDLIDRGQIDAFTILGVLLALQSKNWATTGVAYLLLATKPPNTIPLIIFFFWLTWRKQGFIEAIKGLIIPLIITAFSLLVHGLWLVRWIESYRNTPPQDAWKVSIWRAAEVLELPVIVPVVFVVVVLAVAAWLWRYARTPEAQVILIIATTYMVTIYALSYHFCIIFALVFPVLVAWRWWVGGLLYLLTFLPLVRLYIGVQHAYIDMLFVTAVFIATAVWLIVDKCWMLDDR